MSSTEGAARRGPALSIVSGVLLALAYPRADLGLLALVALVPFLRAIAGAPPRTALLRGYLCGSAFFAVLLYWIPRVMVVYGDLPWIIACLILALLVLYLATYVALFAWVTAASWRRVGPLSLIVAPITWVGLEILRGRLLTGFPWGLLGYSQYRDLPLLQAAAFGGIYAVSFLVLAANAGATLLLAPVPRRTRAAGLALLVLVALAAAGGAVVLRGGGSAPEGERLRVAAIQGNVPQDTKWDPGAEGRIIMDLVRLTRQAAEGGARLVVWPESASPFSFHRPVPRPEPAGGTGGTRAAFAIEPHREYVDLVGGLARDLGVTLIVGSVDYEVRGGEVRALNGAFLVAPDGALGPSYDKVHLVPFGEYVPLRGLLFFVNRMVQGAIAGFAPGGRLEPLPTPLGPAATFICYEAILPEVVRSIAGKGAVLLVNITNDAWFGRSAAPRQHLAMAAVRAVETRRYLVRAANTGISAIVDPYGRILERTRLETRAVLAGSVAARRDATLYNRAGDLFAWGCAILTVLQAAALRAASARRATRGRAGAAA